jgi:pSer/pThr/pTyr-binding forkhead associated (FHA) protein
VPTCPSGHDSASDDFCDVCGVLIGASPELGLDAGPGGGAAAVIGTGSGVAPGDGAPPAEACPQCGVTRSGQFCESCGYDFSTAGFAPAPETVAPAPAPVSVPDAGAPGVAVHWAVVVTADRAYYDSVQAAGGPDAGGIAFPAYSPQRQFALSGTEMRIGRRSVSSGISPEIDLSVPPADPGVSRRHAVLLRSADGTWAVVDPGSANGTLVNGSEIPEGQAVPVRPGDLIHVGAWTAISVVSES